MLQLDWTTNSGLSLLGAVHKVISAQLDIGGQASYQMATFVNATIGVPVETRGHAFTSNPAGGDLFSQCYAHALSLPEYSGATTV